MNTKKLFMMAAMLLMSVCMFAQSNSNPLKGDVTVLVDTSQSAWNADGICATEYAPAITTSDGRNAQMMETYETTVTTTGEMMYQTVIGLENGDYVVEVYANAQYTDGRGFDSDLKDGATDIVYVSANDQRCYVTAHVGTAVSENGVYTIPTSVSDGTLRISLVAEKPGTNWHTIQIKRLVRNVMKEKPKDGDVTVLVDTSQSAWNAGGICATEYAPAITTSDGRKAQMVETYETTVTTTGEMMYQTVIGLENGDYVVEVYANAQYTDGRGFDSDLKDGATDIVYVSANDQRCYVTAHVGTAVSENGVYTIPTSVSDGTLRISLVAEKSGTNWHTIQIKRLVRKFNTTVTANNLEMTYGSAVPELTYTTAGKNVILNGIPKLSTTATKTSPVGTYPIIIERGTVIGEDVGFVDGTLTITKAPLTIGVKSETITEGDDIPQFTLTYKGFKNGDTEADAFTKKPVAETTATKSSPAGTYPITVSGGEAQNYTLSYTDGTLTIEEGAPKDEDLTARVATSQSAWNAGGVCATEYAPAITTSDGRKAQMVETYETTVTTTGEMMYQTIGGLENGDYAVELYANAQYTDGRGFDSDLKDGDTKAVYVSANDRRCYVAAHVGTAVSENGVYTVYAHVNDGTLRIGLTAEKPGTNWHTLQIKKLTLLRVGTVVYADHKTREQGEANPEWTYTVSGAQITGKPAMSCTVFLSSAAGCYEIQIRKGSVKSDLPVYYQPGVMTVTVPLCIGQLSDDEQAEPIFDLQGRRVDADILRKGLYIQGGKVVVRGK